MSGARASGTFALLFFLLAAAFALRLGVALAWPSIHQADEVFQVLEPAHRLWFGYGIVPWEWRLGIRSWLAPGLLAPLIGAASALGLGPLGYAAVVSALMSLTSLSVVAVGFGLGGRIYGRAGALVIGVLCAVWFDFVYFGPKTLTEVMAGHVLVVAVWFIMTAPARLMLIGVLLGLTFILRFHTAPMILVAAFWACGLDLRRRWPLLFLGAAVPVAGQAVLDWLTLGTPLQSVWLNFWVNVVAARSDTYGVLPFYWYPGRLLVSWGPVFALVVGAAALGVRQAPLLGWMVLAHVLAHSLIGHKELRFLYPAMPLLVILAGLGMCRLLSRARGFADASPRVLALSFVALIVLSVNGAISGGYVGNWTSMRGGTYATDWLRGRDDLCGIGIANGPDWKGYWTPTGGYFRLHRDIPMYPAPDGAALSAMSSRFNYASVPRPVGDRLTGFRRVGCAPFNVDGTVDPDGPEWCVYHRPGACVVDPDAMINPALIRVDE
jgi:GPI mannosyltransferase 3